MYAKKILEYVREASFIDDDTKSLKVQFLAYNGEKDFLIYVKVDSLALASGTKTFSKNIEVCQKFISASVFLACFNPVRPVA